MSLPQAALAQTAAAHPLSLHDRIIARYDGTIESDPKVEMQHDLALMDELKANGDTDPDELARMKMLYGLALGHAFRDREALAAIDEGVEILTRAGQGGKPLALELMLNAALSVSASGDLDGAEKRFEHVLALQRNLFGPDSNEVGTTLCSIAYNAGEQGRLAYAIEQMRAGLKRMKPDPASKVAWAANYETYAHLLGVAGRNAEFLEAARVAAKVAQDTLDPGQRGIGLTLSNLASALITAGRYAEAEAIARQAIEIDLKFRGKQHIDTSMAMSILAGALAAQGNAPGAEALLDEAADSRVKAKSTSSPVEPARYWVEAANLARSHGDEAAAERRLASAAQVLAEHKGYDLVRGGLMREQARGALIQGDNARAVALADAGLATFGELPRTNLHVVALVMIRGLALARLGRLDEAYASTEPTATVLEADLLGSGQAQDDLAEIAPIYTTGFSRFALIALLTGHPDRAFRAAQLANLSSLAVTNSAVAARAASGDPRVEAAVRGLDQRIDARRRLDRERSFALGKSAGEVARLDHELAEADTAITAARAEVDRRFPQFGELSRPRPVALAEAQARLAPGSVLLLPLPLDDGVLSMALTAKGLVWEQAGMRGPAFAAAITRMRTALQSAVPGAQFPADAAFALHQAVFPPRVAAAIAPHADLQLLGGGPLAGLPLGVLLTRQPAHPALGANELARAPWLVRDHSFSVVAALQSSAVDAQRPSQIGKAIRFAGVGAPQLGPPSSSGRLRGLLLEGTISVASLRALPSLPGTDRELRAMAQALAPRSSLLLLGADATETRVRAADLSHTDVLAFATHGIIGGGTNAEPALVMTPPAVATEGDDGLLTAAEIAGLRLDADWVILSACDSAGATDAAVPTYSGLARAFFQAGSRSVLVSMWPLRDDVAAQLTVAITANARRMSKPRALRMAELALMRNAVIPGSANPAVWASFNLLER
ncbi:CHAT domain-containing protein [Novosphingobium sp.]|uniref:CHAT domain-containing tetratricopeptide repeat protein n=1 Tax=Novosphingobium sp. TaxID=1874826 RepID=UPI003BA8EF8B